MSPECIDSLMKLITVSGPHTMMTFQGHEFRVQGHRQHFPKMHFSRVSRSTIYRQRPSSFNYDIFLYFRCKHVRFLRGK